MSEQVLHFALTPVQPFVQQSRRTRDLWAGSFLLSWLSGKAMEAAVNEDAVIVFPDVYSDPLFQTILASCEPGFEGDAYIGTLGNHFKATVRNNFDPLVCHRAVLTSWRAVMTAVYSCFVEPALAGLAQSEQDEVNRVWKQQRGAEDDSPYWDMHWVVGEVENGAVDDLDWLDARKLTRLPQGGEMARGALCSQMSDLEALNGTLNRKASRKFWKALAEQVTQYVYGFSHTDSQSLDIRDGEQLSAIALCKRLFPALSESQRREVINWVPGKSLYKADGDSINSRIVKFWPSVAALAATPWLLNVYKVCPEALQNFTEQTEKCDHVLAVAERYSAVPAVRELGRCGWPDGSLYYADSANEFAFVGNVAKTDAKELHAKLTCIRKQSFIASGRDGAAPTRLGSPSQYYAIIAADGDSIGACMRTDLRTVFPEKLAQFGERVKDCLEQKDSQSVLIYAGGDDVLGLATVDSALHTALSIRSIWSAVFQDLPVAERPTISVAISFVHIKRVLRWSIADALSLLHGTAKELMGRDALAVQVQRAGSSGLVWAGKWGDEEEGATETSQRSGAVHSLKQLVDQGMGTNAETYGLVRRLPWLWPALATHDQMVRSLRGGNSPHAIPDMDDQAIAQLIAANLMVPMGLAMHWVIAGRYLRDSGYHHPPASPMNPALLEILRFYNLHSQPTFARMPNEVEAEVDDV